ncbi:MAG: hypothetical protein HZB38_05560, partial [Planctomycetes bacterium]|nr:hypothetical protein [Planctomycetota bacterium]
MTHLTLASWLAATPLHASITMSFDVLDGADPGAPSPPGLVVVDLAVQVSQDDAFHAAGIFALTSNGANF